MNEFDHYKNSFRIVLEPIKNLLEHKKSQLTQTEWVKFAELAKSSIITNPEQYLGKQLPGKDLIRQSVQEIFSEFFIEQNVEV